MPDLTNPQAWNPYSYVLNNPLKYVDPSGNFYYGVGFGAAIAWAYAGSIATSVGVPALAQAASMAKPGRVGYAHHPPNAGP